MKLKNELVTKKVVGQISMKCQIHFSQKMFENVLLFNYLQTCLSKSECIFVLLLKTGKRDKGNEKRFMKHEIQKTWRCGTMLQVCGDGPKNEGRCDRDVPTS